MYNMARNTKEQRAVRLYEILEKTLVKQGFRRENGIYTTCYAGEGSSAFYNKSLILSKFKPEFDGMIVKEISLMESKRVNGRLIYKSCTVQNCCRNLRINIINF